MSHRIFQLPVADRSKKCTGTEIVRDYQRRIIGVPSSATYINNLVEPVPAINSSSSNNSGNINNSDNNYYCNNEFTSKNFNDRSIHFESTNKAGTSDLNHGRIDFNFSDYLGTERLENIVELQISDMYIPSIYSADGVDAPDPFFYKMLYLTFGDLSTQQSIYSSSLQNYHYSFRVDNTNDIAMLCTPTSNKFVFQRPVQTLDTLKCTLSIPPYMRKLKIPLDSLTLLCSDGRLAGVPSLYVQFTIPNFYDITTHETFNDATTGSIVTATNPGVAVYIPQFSSSDTQLNGLAMRQSGYFVTKIINDYTFEIEHPSFDLTARSPGITFSENCTMLVNKNRIAFTLRITTLSPTPTNYIKVVRD